MGDYIGLPSDKPGVQNAIFYKHAMYSKSNFELLLGLENQATTMIFRECMQKFFLKRYR